MSRADQQNPEFFATDIRGSRRFYLDLGRRGRGALVVVAGGWEVCAPTYRMERADFPYLSLELVTAGRGVLQLAGRTYGLGPGSLFAYGPGCPHEITCAPEAPLRKYFVDFHGRDGRTLMEEAGLTPGTCVTVDRLTALVAVWDELIHLGARTHPRAARGAARALEVILLMGATGLTRTGGSSRAEQTLERCERYLHEHFRQVRSLEEVAGACALAPAYLCRLFRRFRGCTPLAYLQRLQMGWAAGRLREAGCLVREVAAELRLDAFQFSRTFKRVHGVSPRTFRDCYPPAERSGF